MPPLLAKKRSDVITLLKIECKSSCFRFCFFGGSTSLVTEFQDAFSSGGWEKRNIRLDLTGILELSSDVPRDHHVQLVESNETDELAATGVFISQTARRVGGPAPSSNISSLLVCISSPSDSTHSPRNKLPSRWRPISRSFIKKWRGPPPLHR